jgi:very-short-patch-repair endonuclease
MTAAEIRLWNGLRRRNLGPKFLRQKPFVFDYYREKRVFIVDFYCPAARLVVEVDGGVHQHCIEYDRVRTRLLNQLGIEVVRFSNEEVLYRYDATLDALREKLDLRVPPLRAALRHGEGERG